jgi:methylglutaconyl-CoA hydratase
MDQHAIITETEGTVARIWLNRPESRNALNSAMLEELHFALQEINHDEQFRIIILCGRGNSFCSGADLKWMEQASRLSPEDNYRDSQWPAKCFHELFASPKITLAGIHGVAFGGALGLIAACDLAVSAENTVFAFSEVKLGLIPATIAPYIFHKAGDNRVMEYLLTGRKFGASEAEMLGLINRCVPEGQLEQSLQDLTIELLQAAPVAQRSIKRLFRSLCVTPDSSTLDLTASLLAETRVSEEAREGIRAFLEKRQPGWINT